MENKEAHEIASAPRVIPAAAVVWAAYATSDYTQAAFPIQH